jgi:hypothetical protein
MHYRMGGKNLWHGRNPVEDKSRLIQEVFRPFNLPHTEHELGLPLAFHDVLAQPFTAARVREFHDWKLALACMNRDRGLFPETLFQAELDRRWRRLFHRFADQDLGAAWAHLRLSCHWPVNRLSYLSKVTLRRWAGGKG